IEVQSHLPAVIGHTGLLTRAITNLISNAAKFSSPGSSPKIIVRGETRGERVRLWIEDDGIGIAPEHQERIFKVFQRLHDTQEYPGTGIGLAIVCKAAEQMGGHVGVESEPGRGSRF